MYDDDDVTGAGATMSVRDGMMTDDVRCDAYVRREVRMGARMMVCRQVDDGTVMCVSCRQCLSLRRRSTGVS